VKVRTPGRLPRIIDARSIGVDTTEPPVDVCIVGAGPAGIYLSSVLRKARLRVAVIEGGALRPSLTAQRLLHGSVVGWPYWRLDGCRFAGVGGSGNRWGGMCRQLDPIDFEHRDWVAQSGWPISHSDLSPYVGEVAAALGLPDLRDDGVTPMWRSASPAKTDFTTIQYLCSPTRLTLGDAWLHDRAMLSDVTLYLHAHALSVRLDESGERLVDAVSLQGNKFRVRARVVVLAAGGIENPRLLLASTAEHPAGLGNQFDQVGRYFMEHLSVPIGHFIPSADEYLPKTTRTIGTPRSAFTALAPSAAAQRERQLLNCSIAFEPARFSRGQPFLGLAPAVGVPVEAAYRSLISLPGVSHGVADTGRNLAGRMWYGVTSVGSSIRAKRSGATTPNGQPGGQSAVSVYFRAEQVPNPSSRVFLGRQRDRFGMPEPCLDWRLTTQDLGSIRDWFALLAAEVQDRGLGHAIPLDAGWPTKIRGGPHHMGTTRMSSDPHHGVVDANCEVHGVRNLFVAGCSVFPTGGYASPTFTMLTLVHRLGDYLIDRLASPAAAG
jgi:choline dehydrogenase-like flavoprotein